MVGLLWSGVSVRVMSPRSTLTPARMRPFMCWTDRSQHSSVISRSMSRPARTPRCPRVSRMGCALTTRSLAFSSRSFPPGRSTSWSRATTLTATRANSGWRSAARFPVLTGIRSAPVIVFRPAYVRLARDQPGPRSHSGVSTGQLLVALSRPGDDSRRKANAIRARRSGRRARGSHGAGRGARNQLSRSERNSSMSDSTRRGSTANSCGGPAS